MATNKLTTDTSSVLNLVKGQHVYARKGNGTIVEGVIAFIYTTLCLHVNGNHDFYTQVNVQYADGDAVIYKFSKSISKTRFTPYFYLSVEDCIHNVESGDVDSYKIATKFKEIATANGFAIHRANGATEGVRVWQSLNDKCSVRDIILNKLHIFNNPENVQWERDNEIEMGYWDEIANECNLHKTQEEAYADLRPKVIRFTNTPKENATIRVKITHTRIAEVTKEEYEDIMAKDGINMEVWRIEEI